MKKRDIHFNENTNNMNFKLVTKLLHLVNIKTHQGMFTNHLGLNLTFAKGAVSTQQWTRLLKHIDAAIPELSAQYTLKQTEYFDKYIIAYNK